MLAAAGHPAAAGPAEVEPAVAERQPREVAAPAMEQGQHQAAAALAGLRTPATNRWQNERTNRNADSGTAPAPARERNPARLRHRTGIDRRRAPSRRCCVSIHGWAVVSGGCGCGKPGVAGEGVVDGVDGADVVAAGADQVGTDTAVWSVPDFIDTDLGCQVG